jgi:hypothetical protein
MARHLLPDKHEENRGNGAWAAFLHGFERRFATCKSIIIAR